MEGDVKKHLWSIAGIAGLALGGVSIAYLAFSQFISIKYMHEPAPIAIQFVTTLVWAAKLVGCILLMKFFMSKFYNEVSVVTTKDVFKMGMASALLSAIVFSAAYYANMVYISPEFYDSIFSIALQDMEQMMNSNVKAQVDEILSSMPKFMFLWNIFYCFIFGTILSAILSRKFTDKTLSTIEE